MMRAKSIVFYLTAMICGVAFFFAMTSAFSIVTSNKLFSSLTSTSKDTITRFRSVVKLKDQVTALMIDTISMIAEKDIDKLEKKIDQYKLGRKFLIEDIKQCESCKSEAQLVSELDKQFEIILNEKILVGKSAEATEFFMQSISPKFKEITEILSADIKANTDRLEKGVTESDELRANSNLKMTIITVIGITLFILIGFAIMRMIRTALGKAIFELDSSSQSLDKTSTNLLQSSSNLSTAATAGASSLQETVATLEEINSIVKRNAEGAQEGASLASVGLATAEKGKVAVAELMESIISLESGSKKVNEILSVIDEIAFQTNLLALNAAVEAARAGEQGRGFAVVAEAVRALAQRSAVAAKDISSLIHNSNELTKASLERANRSSDVFEEVLQKVSNLNTITSEIARGSSEQAAGISQISMALNQIDQLSQSNAKNATEAADSAEMLKSETAALEKCLSRLKRLAGNE